MGTHSWLARAVKSLFRLTSLRLDLKYFLLLSGAAFQKHVSKWEKILGRVTAMIRCQNMTYSDRLNFWENGSNGKDSTGTRCLGKLRVHHGRSLSSLFLSICLKESACLYCVKELQRPVVRFQMLKPFKACSHANQHMLELISLINIHLVKASCWWTMLLTCCSRLSGSLLLATGEGQGWKQGC